MHDDAVLACTKEEGLMQGNMCRHLKFRTFRTLKIWGNHHDEILWA